MKKATIGSIESFTGGLFASTIISKPGASKFFRGTIVAYHEDIKRKLGIDTTNGIVNKRVALEMAEKGREFLGVDICVSFTGEAGPDSSGEKPVGTIFIAINKKVWEFQLDGNRNKIRKEAVQIALSKLGI